MAKFDPPPKFSFKPCEWQEWIEEFGGFRTATKLHKEDGDVQRDSLLYAMGGREANRIFRTLSFTPPECDTDYNTLVSKLTLYFIPKRNIIHERCIFQERVQRASESVEEFVRDIQSLALHCDYSNTTEMVRDRFVMGIHDPSVKQKLQLISDLSLDKAVTIARQNEQVLSQMRAQQQSARVVSEASTRSTGRYAKHPTTRQRAPPPPHQRPQTTGHSTKCDRCGYSAHATDRRCPAAGQKCNTCNRRGHFAAVCKAARQTHAAASEVCDDRPSGSFLGTVDCTTSNNAWYVTLPVWRNRLRFKIDTGADVTVISEETWRAMSDKPALTPTSVNLNSAGGELKAVGEFSATARYKQTVYRFDVIVIAGDTSNLLARDVAVDMGLVQRIEVVTDKQSAAIGLMKTDPVKIQLKAGHETACLTTARRVPFPLMDAVKAELDHMVTSEVIRAVTEPTDWCSAMVPVVKKNGTVRICVDLKRLNVAVRREHLMLPSLEDISPKLAGSKVFSTLDAASGFWQIPLDESSQLMTTFITPFGRYAFRRLPFGISSAPEIFQRKMSSLLEGLSGVEVIMDDILVYGRDLEEHDACLTAVMRRIDGSGLKLNPSKCVVRQSELRYFGHIIGENGVKPDPGRVSALLELSPPNNVSELRTVLGMFQYLSKFVYNMSSVMKPMTDLLRADVSWSWDHAQQSAFDETKRLLTTTPTLTYYDTSKPTVVSADASSFGIGAVLMQTTDGELKAVAFASRTLTSAEQRYSQIEKELLAGVWACEKFSRYLVGLCSFKLLTDHRPLVPLMNTRNLDDTPIRCQRLLMRAMRYNPVVEYVPGKQLVIADALSRKPLPHTPQHDDIELSDDVAAYVDVIERGWPATTDRLARIRDETARDATMTTLMNLVQNGWPRHERAIPHCMRDYYRERGLLSVTDGVIVYKLQIVIPPNMRADILDRLHETHQGITKCRERAAAAVWWPGIGKEITALVDRCAICQQRRSSQREQPLRPTELPELPWQKIAIDICQHQRNDYLVIIDYYSRWIEVKQLTSLTTECVITRLKAVFITHGVPGIIISDNGR